MRIHFIVLTTIHSHHIRATVPYTCLHAALRRPHAAPTPLPRCLPFHDDSYIINYIRRIAGALQDGDESAANGLPELHATLSGLKAFSTVSAHVGIEECRKCCGGQGFLTSSGVSKLSADFSEWVTVEGEQVILSLQCARFLFKAVTEAAAGRPVAAESVQYLWRPDMQRAEVDMGSLRGILDVSDTAWCGHGADMARTWRGHGASMARVWREYGLPTVATTSPEHAREWWHWHRPPLLAHPIRSGGVVRWVFREIDMADRGWG